MSTKQQPTRRDLAQTGKHDVDKLMGRERSEKQNYDGQLEFVEGATTNV